MSEGVCDICEVAVFHVFSVIKEIESMTLHKTHRSCKLCNSQKTSLIEHSCGQTEGKLSDNCQILIVVYFTRPCSAWLPLNSIEILDLFQIGASGTEEIVRSINRDA